MSAEVTKMTPIRNSEFWITGQDARNAEPETVQLCTAMGRVPRNVALWQKNEFIEVAE